MQVATRTAQHGSSLVAGDGGDGGDRGGEEAYLRRPCSIATHSIYSSISREERGPRGGHLGSGSGGARKRRAGEQAPNHQMSGEPDARMPPPPPWGGLGGPAPPATPGNRCWCSDPPTHRAQRQAFLLGAVQQSVQGGVHQLHHQTHMRGPRGRGFGGE